MTPIEPQGKPRTTKRRLLVVAGIAVILLLATLVLVRSLEHNVVTKAEAVRRGMNTNEVLRIMGAPKRTQTDPDPLPYTTWFYEAPGEWAPYLSLRPFRFSVWQHSAIMIDFTPDGSVFSVHIPNR